MAVRFLGFLLVFLVVIPSACMKKKQITGKEYIPRDVLVEVLVDIHLADGVTNDRKFYRRYVNVDSIDLLSPILEKHQVSHEMFDTTMSIYSRYPLLLDQVYNEVLMNLNMMLDENDNEEESNTPGE